LALPAGRRRGLHEGAETMMTPAERKRKNFLGVLLDTGVGTAEEFWEWIDLSHKLDEHNKEMKRQRAEFIRKKIFRRWGFPYEEQK
jgi:hypothetical protein